MHGIDTLKNTCYLNAYGMFSFICVTNTGTCTCMVALVYLFIYR